MGPQPSAAMERRVREIRSYVVRIYRRDARGLWGVVEDVQTGCFHSFHSERDLWMVLAAPSMNSNETRKPE